MISSSYIGPTSLDEDVEVALCLLSEHLTVQYQDGKTHCWQKLGEHEDPEVLEAIAIYLVAAVAQTISANLAIRKALFGEDGPERELDEDIKLLIGGDNAEDSKEEKYFKSYHRDPWIWEGISHLFVHLSRKVANFHRMGPILATTGIKPDVHDHGLDLIGIYDCTDSGLLGILAGESKAYPKRPKKAINDASNKLFEVETSQRDIEIRAVVNQLRSSLSDEDDGRIANAFWKKERSFLPSICCNSEDAPDWSKKRVALERLEVSLKRKTLVPVTFSKVRKAFDAISDFMRAYPKHSS